MSVTTNSVMINKSKSFRDAFSNPKISMYIPVDSNGTVVALESGMVHRLERWVSTPHLGLRAVEELKNNGTGISNATLKHDDDEHFGMLPRSVAFCSLRAMNEWLENLVRDPQGDIENLTLYWTWDVKA